MSNSTLAAFLAGIGSDFDEYFVAEHLGSSSLDDIIELTVDISELQELVEQGMKPIHRNKLWAAIVNEREKRCQQASHRVLLNDFVASNSQIASEDSLGMKKALPNLLTLGSKSGLALTVPDLDQSPKNTKDEEPEKQGPVKCASPKGDTKADAGTTEVAFTGVLTDEGRSAAKDLFKCVAGLLNSTDAKERLSWESAASSAAVVKAAETWGCKNSNAQGVGTLFTVKTILIGLSNALRAGAIPVQGQIVLLGFHENLVNLEYGLIPEHSLQWQSARTRLFKSLSDSLDAFAPDIEEAKHTADLLGKVYEQLMAYKNTDFGQKEKVDMGPNTLAKLVDRLCPRCTTTPCVFTECQKCKSGSMSQAWWASKCMDCLSGKPLCPSCVSDNAKVKKDQEEARAAQLAKRKQEAKDNLSAKVAERNLGREQRDQKGKGKGKGKGKSFVLDGGPPKAGVTIERASASDLALMQKFWKDREAAGEVLEAWSIDNPLRTYVFNERRKEIKQQLGREPDEVEGLHGSDPNNYLSIVSTGFRSDLRGSAVGQVYGSGEYMAKCPDVSVGYCRGGEYMLVCRLVLGHESSTAKNLDGDHIWVPSCQYYVISRPEQILPVFVLKFRSPRSYSRSPLVSPELEKALGAGIYSTQEEEKRRELPPPRPCMMSRPFANSLWLGLMYAHNTDEQLESDVRAFLKRYAPEYTDGMKVQIVRGIFKKAHAINLSKPIPRDLVHKLNTLPFKEKGVEHLICVEDMEGSPEQKCPKWIANYCRGQNLRFTQPCWCWHPRQATESARYYLEDVDLQGAKGNEIVSKFMSTAPFHDGYPTVVGIKAIKNDMLARLHEDYRGYLANKHRQEPKVRELYHGTNNNILDVLYQHGCKPPSDMKPSEDCPISGGKGLCTSLCNNDCKYCTEKHEWNRCHMYGLGIYLADMAQKSHRYVSQPRTVRGRRQYRMIVCSVLGRAFKIEGHLKCGDAMHDVPQVRALDADDIKSMIEPCCGPKASGDAGIELPAEKSDMIFVQGLDGRVRPGYSVVNSEYIAYHPHQCLPKYEITYEL